VNTTVIFEVTNDSDMTNVGFAVVKLAAVDPDDAAVAFSNPPTAVGTTESLSVTFVDTGQYGLSCYVVPGAGETEAEYVTEFDVTG
jgi:hypothetical protein